ncbi:MAG: ATP-binding protein [Bacteroidales bacterium]|nr:ATP-binding protein [Bacteroidales bacterium]
MERKRIDRDVIILRGLQGSGKSTWAKKWAEEKPTERVIVSLDGIRHMLGVYWVPQREDLVAELFRWSIYQCAIKGYNIVVDGTNFNMERIDNIMEVVSMANTQNRRVTATTVIEHHVTFKDFFDVPPEECIRRDAQRPEPVGEAVIRDFYERYKSIIEDTKC